MTTDITAVKEAALVRICDDDTDLAAALELYLTLYDFCCCRGLAS